ncbi:energy transducer TonB [Pelagicoccus sp. SDUM812003]|uniref:energy transducer TonB n=1 Tax=Pelagicoccus sp. SDUM812003 TaxID=3041267 RepID=UPI00280ECE4C|nr:energy transducer TonB [Pelagicoccus sp. SDUM812003]MDQ8204374.1 energy transducer TonB [Pelagicoccus sp. SDUM812003]
MNATYPASRGHRNELAAVSLGGACVLATFALLPLLHVIPDMLDGPETLVPVTVSEVAPPKPPEPPAPPIPQKADKEIPEIERPLPPIDIRHLEGLINQVGNGNATIDTGWGPTTSEDISKTMETFLPDELDQSPSVLVAVKPLYPYSMKHEPGKVVVEFVIAADGRVRNARVVTSTSWHFNQPALDAVEHSKWKPGRKDGQDVNTLVKLPILFKP